MKKSTFRTCIGWVDSKGKHHFCGKPLKCRADRKTNRCAKCNGKHNMAKIQKRKAKKRTENHDAFLLIGAFVCQDCGKGKLVKQENVTLTAPTKCECGGTSGYRLDYQNCVFMDCVTRETYLAKEEKFPDVICNKTRKEAEQ